MRFEFIVALRYLRAKRKQAVISLITVISIVGVMAGVAALVIALAINAGFQQDLQEKLLGARAHVTLLPNPLPLCFTDVTILPSAAILYSGE